MTCRESRMSSAVTTFARDMSGLEDNQVLGLYHALMREEHARLETPEESSGYMRPQGEELSEWHQDFITRLETNYQNGTYTLRSGSHRPERRFRAGRTESGDVGRLYAAERIVERAQQAAEAQRNHFSEYARAVGIDEAQAAATYWTGFTQASDNARLHASRTFERAWLANPDHSSLPVDRRSLYAFEQMESRRNEFITAQQTRPAVQQRDSVHSSFIATVGYDPTNGRMEMTFRRNPERIYAYRMSQEEYNNFRGSNNIGSYFSTNIRSNTNYQYDTQEESDNAGVHRRCGTCGQWAGDVHHCPVTGSEEDLNWDMYQAIQNARATSHNPPPPSSSTPSLSHTFEGPSDTPYTPTDVSTAEAVPNVDMPLTPAPSNNPEPEAIPEPPIVRNPAVRLRLEGTRRYFLSDSNSPFNDYVRIPGLNRAMQTARQERINGIDIGVQGGIRAAENENVPATYGRVSGYANVQYLGRGRGYRVTAVTDGGPSGTDKLKCTCPQYRLTYDCIHVRNTVAHINNLMNPNNTVNIPNANTAVTNNLRAEGLSADEAVERVISGYTPTTLNLSEDTEKFQELYEEARSLRRQRKDAISEGVDFKDLPHPVPYNKEEGALGGLFTRESDQGFGIELEYSFPDDMSYQEVRDASNKIGQELYDLGLTESASQRHYGYTHGKAASKQHARGWSYESDPSTGDDRGEPVQGGGEIISPIMYDEAETWTNIEKVCDIVRRNGGKASFASGAHVNVGTAAFDHKVERHNRLLALYGENEDLLYRLSSNPDASQHRPYAYCLPNNLPSTPYSELGGVRNGNYHGVAVSLNNSSGRNNDRAEFRMFDSSLEPSVLQAQILVAGALTNRALREEGNPRPNRRREPVGTHLTENPRRTALVGEAWNQSTAPVREFIDKYIPGGVGQEKRVQQIIGLFASTKWQTNSR